MLRKGILAFIAAAVLAVGVVSYVGATGTAQGVVFHPTFKDYVTAQTLACGGTYVVVYGSWFTSKINAQAQVGGTAQLEIDTYRPEYAESKVWRDFWNMTVPNDYVGRFDLFLTHEPEEYRFISQVRGTDGGPIVTQTCDLTLSEAAHG